MEQYLHIGQLKLLHSLIAGPVCVVVSLLKQLGIFGVPRSSLTPQQAVTALARLEERREPILQALYQRNHAPANSTCMTSLRALSKATPANWPPSATTATAKRGRSRSSWASFRRLLEATDIQTRPIRHFHEAQVRGHVFACFLAYRVAWELRQRLEPVLRRDRRTQRCEAGSLAEIWHDLSTVTLAKLSANGKTFLRLSQISPYVQKLLTLCKVPSLEDLQLTSE